MADSITIPPRFIRSKLRSITRDQIVRGRLPTRRSRSPRRSDPTAEEDRSPPLLRTGRPVRVFRWAAARVVQECEAEPRRS